MIDRELKDAVRKSWDESSELYDSCSGHGIGTGEEKAAWKQELGRDLPGLPGSQLIVLDIGCGTGVMGLLFAEMGHRVTGIDLSEGMLAKAREKASAQNLPAEFKTGDAELLPFGKGLFDVVVNRHLLWTLPHPDAALKEWHRVLKTGGVLLVIEGVWNDRSFRVRAKRFVSDGLSRIFGHHHGGHYDENLWSELPFGGGVPKETMADTLEHAGFTGISFRDLMYIREIQKRGQPWYQRFAPAETYYIAAAKKED